MKKTDFFFLIPLLLPFVFYLYLIYNYASGFPVSDDWTYILSFQYLAVGDFKALWASMCEHRPIFAKLMHYTSYVNGHDGKPLLYFSQIGRLITAIIMLYYLAKESHFAENHLGSFVKIAAISAMSLALFSPVQAWAIARPTYIEGYLCVLGAVLVIAGLAGFNSWLIGIGLVASVVSTPGWLVLLPFAVVLFITFCIIKQYQHRKRLIISSATIALIIIGFSLINQLPFSHPNNHTECLHPSQIQMAKLIILEPKEVVVEYMTYIGFFMAWLPNKVILETNNSIGVTTLIPFVGGVFFLVGSIFYIIKFLINQRGSLFAVLILLWSLIMAFSLTLSRYTVLGERFTFNFYYPLYITPGWAVLLFLLIQSVGTWKSKTAKGIVKHLKIYSVVALIFICLFFSFPKGYRALLKTMKGMNFLQGLYYEGFISKSADAVRKQEIAEILFSAYPDDVYKGTEMFENLGGFPKEWLK
jgi:hypothetical protein